MNRESENAIAKAHEEVATRNSVTALNEVKRVEAELKEHMKGLHNAVAELTSQLAITNQRVNLMLTKHFSGGSTSE